MNAFEYINELKSVMLSNMNDDENKFKTISYKDHCLGLLNTLSVLEEELKRAEYNYEIEAIDKTVYTLNGYTVLRSQLNEDVLLFQPLSYSEDCIDLESLTSTLTDMRNCNLIKQDIVVVPPDISIFRAKLKREEL